MYYWFLSKFCITFRARVGVHYCVKENTRALVFGTERPFYEASQLGFYGACPVYQKVKGELC